MLQRDAGSQLLFKCSYCEHAHYVKPNSLKSQKVNMSLHAPLSIASITPSSQISLLVLRAKREGKDPNHILFSHVNDVRAPVNTSDGDCSEQLSAPGLSFRFVTGGCILVCSVGISIKHRCSCITAGKLAHCHMNPGTKLRLFTTASAL